MLTVLSVRGIAIPDGARERILAEKDMKQLKRWLEKAVLASSIAERTRRRIEMPGLRGGTPFVTVVKAAEPRQGDNPGVTIHRCLD